MPKSIEQLKEAHQEALAVYDRAHHKWMNSSIFNVDHEQVQEAKNIARENYERARVAYWAALKTVRTKEGK